MNISIVTCWYEHHELAADYVYAVEDELADDDEVIIIDNGDAPALPLHFRVITVGENLGFAEGSNAGLRRARCEAIVFLNNDVSLGRRGWLDDIRTALEPSVLVGPLHTDRFYSQVDGQPIPYLDGWCLAGMRDDLVEIGGFDAELEEPAYYSDNLLCLEARAAGMTLRELRVGLTHKLNVTAGPFSASDVQAAFWPNRDRYLARAREHLVAA